MSTKVISSHIILFQGIKLLVEEARQHVTRSINKTMLLTNFEIGRMIIEHEQHGKSRASYAKETLKNLSNALNKEFGRGYSVDNLELMRKFYLTYQKSESAIRISYNSQQPISESTTRKSKSTPLKAQKISFPFTLTWTHYVQLLKIRDEKERKFYEIEATQNNWSVKELLRQFNTALYERIALSKDKKGVRRLAQKGQTIEKTTDILKSHYVLEFLDLKEDSRYTETELETAIINKLEHFMLELGKGFLFEGRQRRFTFEGDSFYVDLVFYNRLLKCFVLFDLKMGELTHQDIGQMQMYVNYYDRMIKTKEENSTIGIILCKQENKTVVEFTLPENNKTIFAKEYKQILPSKEELKKQLK